MSVSPPDGFALIKPGQTYLGKQGIIYGAGASKETVGAQKICMNVMPMPPGGREGALPQGYRDDCLHARGECAVYYGDHLEKRVDVRQAEQCFCDANIPHAPRNESGKPCTWIVVHSSGSDQDGIVLLPELDKELAERLAAKTRDGFSLDR